MLDKWLEAFPPKNQNPISCVTEFRESLGGVEGGVHILNLWKLTTINKKFMIENLLEAIFE